jgi:hypothetical protein
MTVRQLPPPPALAEQTLEQLEASILEGVAAAGEVRRRLNEEQQTMRRERFHLIEGA